MASYVKFQQFVEDLAHGVHDLESDQLVVALTTNANIPSVSADAVLGDITEISYTNLSSRNITTSSSGQTSGTYAPVLTDLTLTASGAVAPFRHVVVYNDTPTTPADPLICMFDHGSDVTLASSETFTIDFNASGLFTLA
jgi:hypothetical protein